MEQQTKDVLVRKPIGNGNNELFPVQEISRDGDTVKVVFRGQKAIEEVSASSVVANSHVYGSYRRDGRTTGRPVIRIAPGRGSLANLLSGR